MHKRIRAVVAGLIQSGLVLSLGSFSAQTLANPVIAVEEANTPALFNRLQVRGGGVATLPDDDLTGLGYQLGAAGYWVLVPWAVLELGGQYQAETFSHDSDSDYRLSTRGFHYGGRLLWPPGRGLYASLGGRWHRGQLSVDDAGSDFSNMRLAYNWYEAGLHLNPDRHGTEAGVTLRYYEWANDDDQWTVAGEWMLPGEEWSLGLDGEVALEQDFFQVGVSINRRF